MAIAIPPLQVGWGGGYIFGFPLNVISNLLLISCDLFALRKHLFIIIIIIIIIIIYIHRVKYIYIFIMYDA